MFMVWRPRVRSQLLSKLMPSFRLIEKVSPEEFTPQVVGWPPTGPPKAMVGRTLLFVTPGNETFVWVLNSSLISPIHPNPAVITRLDLNALEYVRNRPVPSLGWFFWPDSSLLK